MKFTFQIEHHGERAAGIHPYTDTLTIELASGEPGGESGEFQEHIRKALLEWYDGAIVMTEAEYAKRGEW